MAAALLKCVSACAPAQFCGEIPFASRHTARRTLHDSKLIVRGEVYKCDCCPAWHIRSLRGGVKVRRSA